MSEVSFETRVSKHVKVIIDSLVYLLSVYEVLAIGFICFLLESVAFQLHVSTVYYDSLVERRARHGAFETTHESKLVSIDLLDVANRRFTPLVGAIVFEHEGGYDILKCVFEDVVHLHGCL